MIGNDDELHNDKTLIRLHRCWPRMHEMRLGSVVNVWAGPRQGWSTNANHQKYREADGLGR